MSMATRTTTADTPPDEDVSTRALTDSEVLQCRNPDYELCWYYGREDGASVRYHPLEGYRPVPMPETAIACVVSDPDVSVCRVGRGHLEVARGDGR